MVDSYYKLAIPVALQEYYHVTDVIKSDLPKEKSISTEVLVVRDSQGYVSSVKYFTPEKDLSKEICYQNKEIYKINYYRGGRLYSTEEYRNDLLEVKFVYLKNGQIAYMYQYSYDNKGKIVGISKQTKEREIAVMYKYDEFDRISAREIYLNGKSILHQHYGYDILDRISEYSDDNQRIKVIKLSHKNELLSYVVTDKNGNNIEIENNITKMGYESSRVSINGHYTIVKDPNYVDNLILKKPHTSEDDLDLIIANIFGVRDDVVKTKRETNIENLLKKIINDNVEERVFPISMRKLALYQSRVTQQS